MSHILGVDIETTGLDKNQCAITEIAFIHYNGEERLSDFVVKIRPGEYAKYSLGALKITKQTLNTLNYDDDLVSSEEAINQIINYLVNEVFSAAGNKEIKILGHNVDFDIDRLKILFSEHNIMGWEEVFSRRLIDTSIIGEYLRQCGVVKLDKMSLANLGAALGVESEGEEFHTALYDIDFTFKCYFEMLKLGRKLNG